MPVLGVTIAGVVVTSIALGMTAIRASDDGWSSRRIIITVLLAVFLILNILVLFGWDPDCMWEGN